MEWQLIGLQLIVRSDSELAGGVGGGSDKIDLGTLEPKEHVVKLYEY